MYKYNKEMWMEFVGVKLRERHKIVDAFWIVSPRRFGPYTMLYSAFKSEWLLGAPDKKGQWFHDFNHDSRQPQWGFKGARILSLPPDDIEED